MVRFVFILGLLLGPITEAATWSSAVETLVKKEIREIGAKPDQFGLWVQKGNEKVGVNAQTPLVPASLSKIPTALTFLNEYSMDQKFKTWVYHTGSIENGLLKGDLSLKGGGDPTLVTESLWLMANKLKRSDIKEIKGQLYVDESFFDTDYYSKGRQQKRVDRAYDAPVSALSFNWNAISIYVRPGEKSGAPARVYTDPELPFIQINNRAKTYRGSKTDLKVERKYKDDQIIINVSGRISKDLQEKAFYKSIKDAAKWTGAAFAQTLNKAGIQYSGDVKSAQTPDNATLLLENKSWSIPRVMAALSKFSNNFVAEALTKHLGRSEQIAGNIDDGLSKITTFLNKKGWKSNEYEFVNPSGFTRENRIRADRLGELLHSARKNFELAPEFLSSLPISGTDGTLKSRMKQTMKGKVRAKTGYLTGVVALAGYLEARDGGEPLTFVFIYNGPYKKDWEVRAMFNRLLWRIYQKS